MGEWIRKIFSDSGSFTGRQMGEGTSLGIDRDGRINDRLVIIPRSSINNEENAMDPVRGYLDILVSITAADDITRLIEVISKDLPRTIHFDFGTLRWNPLDPQNDEWMMDQEDEFPDSIDFIAEGGALSGSSSIEVEGSLDRDRSKIWSGGMEGVCRAHTQNGDPILVRFHSGLVIPLRRKERNIGTLSLFSTRMDGLTKYADDPMAMSLWEGLGTILGRTLEMVNAQSDLRRTRELLDSTEDLLVLWKSSGSFWEIECNRKAEAYIDREDLNPEMMEGPFFAPPGKEWERAMFVWKKAYNEGQAYQLDLELISPSGERIPYLCTFSPYIVDDEICGVKMSGMKTDSIDKAVTSMESSNKGYRLLLSLLSHDLKNPLSAISGYNELLKRTDDSKKEKYTDKIALMTKKMTNIIKLTGMLAQVQEGKLEKEFHPMDISETIKSSLEELEPKASSYDIRFEQEEGSFVINGHIFLEQVITNLLDNAMKYSPEGSKIEVELSTDLNGLKIVVKDEGPGIPEEHRTSIFDRFDRGGARNGISGSGLGLAISKGIVDLHGGRLWMEDNKPRGSIFNVTLPWSNS